MRFPSISYLLIGARDTILRFPLVLVSAGLAAAAAIVLTDSTDEATPLRFLQIGTLGIPLFLAFALAGERWHWGAAPRVALGAVGVGALTALYFALADWANPIAIRRYAQFSLGLHLLVAVLPFARVGELNGFWQYNKALFLRFLIAAIYSFVLYAGLAVAIGALDKLLGLPVPGETYSRLWFIIAFVFNTWFFLGGVPRDLAALDAQEDYPRGLRVFSQYVLVPLVTIYLVILTTYLGRIVITRVWPSGWIGYLVTSVSVLGILSLLLVHPVRNRPGQRWIAHYARWFYVALIPSLVMLLLAIWQRIEQYGVTENRYFMVALSLWLAGISAYYIFSRSKSIKIIPASLLVIALTTSFGPWGAYSVSRKSQRARLAGLLERHALLADGVAHAASTDVPAEDRKEIGAGFAYLAETHGTDAFADWFEGGLAGIDTVGAAGYFSHGSKARDQAKLAMNQLGLEYLSPWESATHRSYNLTADIGPTPVRVGEYEYVLESQRLVPAGFSLDDARYELNFASDSVAIHLTGDADTLVRIPMRSLLERAREYQLSHVGYAPIPRDLMTTETEADRIRVRLNVASVSAYENEDGVRLTSLSGTLYLAFRDD